MSTTSIGINAEYTIPSTITPGVHDDHHTPALILRDPMNDIDVHIEGDLPAILAVIERARTILHNTPGIHNTTPKNTTLD